MRASCADLVTTDVPWPTRFFVHPAKIAFYLLDADAPEGASKGAYLMNYGFDASESQVLEAALLAHADQENFQGNDVTEWGSSSCLTARSRHRTGAKPGS